ncbi:hypothetical protein COCON_G00057760 [Conger conger]|uniref:Uncharacterized protein n=1 Tax=Conger conger TaxID=82655 RepID=A0A9Q1DQS9_CONCO|nr:hypothetical protein COCON_G00057760 [Conger conger]
MQTASRHPRSRTVPPSPRCYSQKIPPTDPHSAKSHHRKARRFSLRTLSGRGYGRRQDEDGERIGMRSSAWRLIHSLTDVGRVESAWPRCPRSRDTKRHMVRSTINTPSVHTKKSGRA